ncbi:MAG: metallophosphoesterase, partial [Elusimicrobiota bacterium]
MASEEKPAIIIAGEGTSQWLAKYILRGEDHNYVQLIEYIRGSVRMDEIMKLSVQDISIKIDTTNFTPEEKDGMEQLTLPGHGTIPDAVLSDPETLLAMLEYGENKAGGYVVQVQGDDIGRAENYRKVSKAMDSEREGMGVFVNSQKAELNTDKNDTLVDLTKLRVETKTELNLTEDEVTAKKLLEAIEDLVAKVREHASKKEEHRRKLVMIAEAFDLLVENVGAGSIKMLKGGALINIEGVNMFYEQDEIVSKKVQLPELDQPVSKEAYFFAFQQYFNSNSFVFDILPVLSAMGIGEEIFTEYVNRAIWRDEAVQKMREELRNFIKEYGKNEFIARWFELSNRMAEKRVGWMIEYDKGKFNSKIQNMMYAIMVEAYQSEKVEKERRDEFLGVYEQNPGDFTQVKTPEDFAGVIETIEDTLRKSLKESEVNLEVTQMSTEDFKMAAAIRAAEEMHSYGVIPSGFAEEIKVIARKSEKSDKEYTLLEIIRRAINGIDSYNMGHVYDMGLKYNSGGMEKAYGVIVKELYKKLGKAEKAVEKEDLKAAIKELMNLRVADADIALMTEEEKNEFSRRKSALAQKNASRFFENKDEDLIKFTIKIFLEMLKKLGEYEVNKGKITETQANERNENIEHLLKKRLSSFSASEKEEIYNAMLYGSFDTLQEYYEKSFSLGRTLDYKFKVKGFTPSADTAHSNIDGVIKTLANMPEHIRPKNKNGDPGDVVYLPKGVRAIPIGDLHGRIENLAKILSAGNNWADIKSGKAALVIMGDAVHPESPYDLKQMEASIMLINIIMALKNRFPEQVFYTLGNHDGLFYDGVHYRVEKDGVDQTEIFFDEIRRL